MEQRTKVRLTKIICTLGPATSTPESLRSLAEAGMNIARLNLSHGKREDHRRFLKGIDDLNHSLREHPPALTSSCVATLLDIRGAQIRTGERLEPLSITKGEEVIFTANPAENPHSDERRPVITVNYEGFANDVRETDRILIDNGELLFEVVRIEPNGDVIARASTSGLIGSRRHINLPGADVDLPSITERDWDDIAFAADEGVDFLGLSFIRSAEEVRRVHAFLKERGSTMEVIAKIETMQAVEDIVEIIREAGGVMVARGDLGAELPFERLPVIQDEIVVRCREAGKPVIVATHMLESMTVHPLPTRAEVTDIAHAATTSADATMLSGETARGKYPLLALEAMDRVLRATEEHVARFATTGSIGVHNEREARAEAACTLAHSSQASALVIFTKTGQTARDISRCRPAVPIYAFTDQPEIQRKLQLSFGVVPFTCAFPTDPEETVQRALDLLTGGDFLSRGEKVVLVSDTRAHERMVNTVQLRAIG